MARLTVRRIQLAVYLDMKCSIKSKIDLALHILETDLKKAHNSRIDQDHRNNSGLPVPKKKSGRSMHYLYCLEWASQTHIDWFEYEPDVLTFPWRRTWTFALPGRLVANRLFRRRIRQYYALWWWFVSKILLGKRRNEIVGRPSNWTSTLTNYFVQLYRVSVQFRSNSVRVFIGHGNTEILVGEKKEDRIVVRTDMLSGR